MGKIAALDLGDVWVGIALSDSSRIMARPYQTVAREKLESFLAQLVAQESIDIIVLGHPKTLKGTASQQTEKTEQFYQELQRIFPTITWVLWDERLTSKWAGQQRAHKIPTAQERHKAHAIAAAYILDSYLTFLKAQ